KALSKALQVLFKRTPVEPKDQIRCAENELDERDNGGSARDLAGDVSAHAVCNKQPISGFGLALRNTAGRQVGQERLHDAVHASDKEVIFVVGPDLARMGSGTEVNGDIRTNAAPLAESRSGKRRSEICVGIEFHQGRRENDIGRVSLTPIPAVARLMWRSRDSAKRLRLASLCRRTGIATTMRQFLGNALQRPLFLRRYLRQAKNSAGGLSKILVLELSSVRICHSRSFLIHKIFLKGDGKHNSHRRL